MPWDTNSMINDYKGCCSGYCIEMASTLTVVICTLLNLPVSSTHAQVGAVVFVGIFAFGFWNVRSCGQNPQSYKKLVNAKPSPDGRRNTCTGWLLLRVERRVDNCVIVCMRRVSLP